MNRIFEIGNLVRDPELKQTTNGISVCNFTIAVNRTSKGVREVDYFDVVAWRGLAENCHRYLKKGRKVAVVGELHTRTYETQNGKRRAFEIAADDVEFLSRETEQTEDAFALEF